MDFAEDPSSTANGNSGASNSIAPEQPRAIPSHYAHLPTPQSPNNFTNYIPGPSNLPDSPMSHLRIDGFSHSSHSFASSSRSVIDSSGSTRLSEAIMRSPSRSQQIMTPESSPFASRLNVHNNSTPSTPIPRTIIPSTMNMSSFVPQKTPSPPPISDSQSQLSSPFMSKTDLTNAKSSRPSSASPGTVNEVISSSTLPSSTIPSISTPPVSPLLESGSISVPSTSTTPPVSAGGELDRIHHAIQQQHEALENRRPDYLMRAKRTLSDADPSALMEEESIVERDRYSSVGIMDSPMKGRRIKLFQETSEESFEESLMAGGYGRYRTAEWVRQPQPIVVAPGTGTPLNVVAHLEEAQQQEPPPPPTEKELRKRKRLDAFPQHHRIDIAGKGRVLLDVPTERSELDTSASAKKRGAGKRKKKAEPTAKERRAAAAAAAAEEAAEKPNWPDEEFPWRLRTEERVEHAKAEEEERLKVIEKFLDRDTDDDDDGDGESVGEGTHDDRGDDNDDNVLPSSVWGVVFEDDDDRPLPYRAGRGKMVPLRGDPDQERRFHRKRNAYFPSDPADARAALLSKKSVRALSFRRQRSKSRRASGSGSEDEETLCICNGRDDGRELVQCDRCNTWYHLGCIGIQDIGDLGAAEDQWFCFSLRTDNDSSATVDVSVPDVEPTFAPTDETPRRRQADSPFFQPPAPESPTQSWGLSSIPQIPKTPTRGAGNSSEFGSSFSSSSAHLPSSSSSRHGPLTPRHHPRDVRVITASSPYPYDMFGSDDSQFDPTSTPSRGIKFGMPFTTPKNTISSRAFHTPSKPNTRGGAPGFGGTGFLSSALNERGGGHIDHSPYHRPQPYSSDDSSPIRREGRMRRIADAHSSRALFEESPLQTKGKGRALDFGVGKNEIS
ncbi:hypothetical protein BDP27DRAFT_1421825 [Rhodocollybia butyracea]|uniref:Zinc finger PHD-type domain-containing protein n=1 Tax=Rhodocollybia butyracea TaxID=206335 RepID=A0A9P5PME1_9AGAR|nr:hypothetical protein BDP27DRAFT_1421825 [Rhodocollybia butyracea]